MPKEPKEYMDDITRAYNIGWEQYTQPCTCGSEKKAVLYYGETICPDCWRTRLAEKKDK